MQALRDFVATTQNVQQIFHDMPNTWNLTDNPPLVDQRELKDLVACIHDFTEFKRKQVHTKFEHMCHVMRVAELFDGLLELNRNNPRERDNLASAVAPFRSSRDNTNGTIENDCYDIVIAQLAAPENRKRAVRHAQHREEVKRDIKYGMNVLSLRNVFGEGALALLPLWSQKSKYVSRTMSPFPDDEANTHSRLQHMNVTHLRNACREIGNEHGEIMYVLDSLMRNVLQVVMQQGQLNRLTVQRTSDAQLDRCARQTPGRSRVTIRDLISLDMAGPLMIENEDDIQRAEEEIFSPLYYQDYQPSPSLWDRLREQAQSKKHRDDEDEDKDQDEDENEDQNEDEDEERPNNNTAAGSNKDADVGDDEADFLSD